jgi:hypothetical protein
MIPPKTGLAKDPNWTFRAVGVFVPKITHRARAAHGLHTADIILNWPSIVGDDLAAYTVPRRIRWPKAPERAVDGAKPAASGRTGSQKTTLEIWVAGGRAHEVPYLKSGILNRINAYFGYRAVTDLIPVDGPLARPKARPRSAPPQADEVARVAARYDLAADDPLSAALAKLGANVARRR